MPKCREGYRSKRVDELMNGRSVVQMALDLAMMIRGSSEGNPQSIEDCVEILRFYLNNWQGPNDQFDEGVRNLIRLALEKYNRYTEKQKK